MAAAFLGGLGSFATSFMKGYEQSEDREALLKQRQFEEGQRQRKLDEQRRSDELRTADAGVLTTEDVEVPGTKTIYGKESPVVRDDDGNLMPGAVDTPATTVKRQRSWDAIYRDYAANRQKAGDTAGALEFTDKANKVAAQRSANAFLQVQADAESKTPTQIAQEIGKIFDSDPMNGGTKSIEELPDGGVRMTLFNKDTGKESTREFRGPRAREDLLAAFTPYFRPEAYARMLDRKLETQEKYREELSKPRTLKPGERLLMPNKDGGFTSVAENPTDRVQIGEDADGNPIYGKPSKYLRGVGQGGVGSDGDGGDGTGGSKKSKGKTPIDLATSSVMDAIKESAESKTLNADQLIGVQATARELVANAARNGQEIDPYVAGKIALTAVLKPESVKPAYNPATGTFESTVAYNGNTFSVGRVDPTALPESQLKGVAQAFVSKLPAASRGEYVRAASGDAAAVDKINADIVAAHGKAWADRFRASTGRAPTQQDVQASIARTQAIVGQNIDLVRRSGIVEQTKKNEERAVADKERADAQAAIGTPSQIMALPRGEAERIYRQYNRFTDARQREALQMKMAQDRRIAPIGGLRQQ